DEAPLLEIDLHRWREAHHQASPAMLGVAQRKRRAMLQFAKRGGVTRRQGKADTGGDLDHLIDPKGAPYRVARRFRKCEDGVRACRAHYHRKPAWPQPAKRDTPPDRGAQPVGDCGYKPPQG